MFEGIGIVRKALDTAYGTGKVSMVSAAFRWLNHHSKMKPEHNGESPGSMVWSGCCPSVATDAIILGASCLEHLNSNMDACKEGPLDQRGAIICHSNFPSSIFFLVFRCGGGIR